jgi:hypothetical protein
MSMNFFYVYQSPVPSNYTMNYADKLVRIASQLSAPDERFKDFAKAMSVKPTNLTMKERIELTAELNALVAKHYGLSRSEFQVILDSFDGFEEDKNLSKFEGEIKWSDDLIRKFNGEVRKRVMHYYDSLS